MKVVIVGGGPGGLYLATLLKRADYRREVVVVERNRPDDPFGFGVVFSDNTMSALERDDPRVTSDLTRLGPSWNAIEVRLHGRRMRCGGIGFTSIARKALLSLLQGWAVDAGVELRFETNVERPDDVPDHDLLVAADGVNSVVRGWQSDRFGYQPATGSAKFIWLGTIQLLDCLTFIFESSEHGVFGVHAYPFDEQTSTFLVETDEATWRAAGLDAFDPADHPPGESDHDSVAYLAKLFAGHLGGHELLASNSKWLSFVTVRNRRWFHEQTVLIGDAAHTAHFSVGSGTRMAMEDALALSQALDEHDRPDAALAAYERQRRPEVERIQEAAAPSLRWWEHFRDGIDWPAEPFTFHFLTRTPRITRASLERRDPAFVREVDTWWQAETGEADPLSTPLALGGFRLRNRVAVRAQVASGHPGGEHVTGAMRDAGLVLTDPLPTGDGMAAIVDSAREGSSAAVGARVDLGRLDRLEQDIVPAVSGRVAAAGFDLLMLIVDDEAERMLTDLVGAFRDAWPVDRPLAIELPLVLGTARDAGEYATASLARSARDAGCDLIAVSAGTPEQAAAEHWKLLAASERIRLDLGVPTMLMDGIAGRDEAASVILAGRADLCCW